LKYNESHQTIKSVIVYYEEQFLFHISLYQFYVIMKSLYSHRIYHSP